jgi:leader peptidase (prepilin peptidase)/N-methyltransferase
MEFFLFNITLILLGGSLGSFASMLIYRLPLSEKEVSIIKPRSFCPNCKEQLSIWQLLPFVSFIMARGQCKNCHQKINIMYFVNECLMAFLVLYFTHITFSSYFISAAMLAIVFILYIQSVIDFQKLLLSTPLSFLLIIIGIIINFKWEIFTISLDALLGLILGYGILFSINLLYRIIRSQDGIGSGDFLLLGGIGSVFGASSLGPILLMGSSLTLALHILKIKTETKLPLGFGIGMASIFYLNMFVWIKYH